MEVNVGKVTGGLYAKSDIRRHTFTRVSRGGLDEINPDDIVYGEYASGKQHGTWLDAVYLDDDILRTYSGPVRSNHRLIEELKILLRDEDAYYVIPIKEVPSGFAFKRTDIESIEVNSLVGGDDKHVPSCVWKMHFKDGSTRTLEAEYQSYFAYGNIIRPKSMTNVSILDKVFANNTKG